MKRCFLGPNNSKNVGNSDVITLIQRKLKIVLLLHFFSPYFLFAQYEISAIPQSLLKNAGMVIRKNDTKFTYSVNEEMTLIEHTVVSVLKESMRKYARFYEEYDKEETLKLLSLKVFNANGEVVQKYKSGNEIDFPLPNLEHFAADSRRCKRLIPENIPLPYTVEIVWEKKMPAGLFLPRWSPIGTVETSCENASFIAEHDISTSFHWRSNGLKHDSLIVKSNKMIHTWKIENQPALCENVQLENWSKKIPSIRLFPNEFTFKGFAGNLRSWKDFGDWSLNLDKGRDDFELSEEFQDSLKHFTSSTDKVKFLYRQLQLKMHYTSIQLGIGGWQSAKTKETWENNYGDCKALTFLMQSMLKKAGIESKRVLIWGGNDGAPEYTQSAEPIFNHVILCAFAEEDSIWLECTSQSLPAGYLGAFTSNRQGLMLKEGGSSLVKTPILNEKNSQLKVVSNCKVLTDYNLQSSNTITSNGLFLHEAINRKSNTEIKTIYDEIQNDFFKNRTSLGEYTFKTSLDQDTAIENFQMKQQKFAAITGNRVKTPSMTTNFDKLLEVFDTSCNVEIDYLFGITISYSLTCEIPAYSEIIYKPEPFLISNSAGSFFYISKCENNLITTTFKCTYRSGVYKNSQLEELNTLSRAAKSCNSEAWIFMK